MPSARSSGIVALAGASMNEIPGYILPSVAASGGVAALATTISARISSHWSWSEAMHACSRCRSRLDAITTEIVGVDPRRGARTRPLAAVSLTPRPEGPADGNVMPREGEAYGHPVQPRLPTLPRRPSWRRGAGRRAATRRTLNDGPGVRRRDARSAQQGRTARAVWRGRNEWRSWFR